MTVYLVCGGRDFHDLEFMDRELSDRTVTAIVHGDAKGADKLAGQWAAERGIPEIVVPANWTYHKRSAGPIRNCWMLKFVKVDVVLAFPGGRGTANMMTQAKKAGIPVKEMKKLPVVFNKRTMDAPDDAVYIGRGSIYGNPYKVGPDGTRSEVIQKFERNILPDLDVSELRGKDLVCFCAPKPCHGDPILRKANR